MILIARKKRKKFYPIKGKSEIESIIDRLPGDDECFKFISTCGFSSICFVMFVAQKVRIKRFYVSTFHVGKKEILILDQLHKTGRLDYAFFLLFKLVTESKSNKDYGYFELLQNICNKNKWDVSTRQNHSKVLLFDTENGKYVIETSSNLNENPKVEQFSFEKDESAFDFYMKNLFECDGDKI